MDQSNFQGEVEALIAGTRREFWSLDNLKIYGDERHDVNSCGASDGSNKSRSIGDGTPTETREQALKDKALCDGRIASNVGRKRPQDTEVPGGTSSSSSGRDGEDKTPMTELDLLVQKYDRRLKQLNPRENQMKPKKPVEIAKERSGKYKCEACGKRFASKKKLNQHFLIHGEERKFACDICDKSFKQPRTLSQHRKIHNSKFSYDCPVCDYSSKRKAALLDHLSLHSEEAKFKCERCPKAYKRGEAYRRHRLTHTFDVPFRCENCDYGFKTKDRLKQHRKIHEDIREFECEVCSKAFKNSWDLKRHSNIHSNGKLFPCDKCSKAFNCKGSLKRHDRTHTGERPFICWDCTKAFATSSNLNQHRRICPKLDFRIKDLPEEDFSPANGNLMETFASTIYPDNDDSQMGFMTMDKEGAEDAPPESEDLDGTFTGRVIQAARSSSFYT